MKKTNLHLIYLFWVVAALALAGCDRMEIKTYYDDHQQLESVAEVDRDGHKNGYTHTYFESGELKALEKYVDDRLDSVATYYWKNGRPRKVVEYANGIPKGKTVWYFQNGNLNEEQSYRNGLLDGWARKYFENGQLQTETQYLAGEIHGQTREWYENGARKSIYARQFGSPVGEAKEWYADGQLKLQGQYVGGIMGGDWMEYDEEGRILLYTHHLANAADALFTVYWPSGKVRATGGLYLDRLHGALTKYDAQGRTIATSKWINGVDVNGVNDLSWVPNCITLNVEILGGDTP